MGVAFSRVQVLESFSVFIGDALRAPNLFSEKIIASKLLNQKRHVGIGTTSPVSAFEVVDTSGAGNAFTATSYSSSGGSGAGWTGRHARGTMAAPTAVLAGDRLAGYWGAGYNGSGWPNATAIVMNAAENYTGSANGGYLTFETTPIGSTTRVERMRVDSTGFVGIGFTCPFFRSSIGTISRATQRTFKNFRTQAKRHRKRAQGGGSPRAAPFLVTV